MKQNYIINTRTIHILGWLAYLVLFTLALSVNSSLSAAFSQAALTVLVNMVVFYLNGHLLMPRFFEKKKYGLYLMSSIGLILIAVASLYAVQRYGLHLGEAIPSGRPGRPGMDPELMDRLRTRNQSGYMSLTRAFLRNLSSVLAVLLLSTVSKMYTQRIEKEKREASIQHEQLMTEMKFLKSQVNPHFLFNALNNIYALVYLKHENAPVMLLKLSDMLRYMLYECNDEWVSLNKEIEYIRNYIALQQLKTEEPQRIVTMIETVDTDLEIPPLLLIPFIENSFKHSNVENTSEGWVAMHLNVMGEQIIFEISNNLPLAEKAKDQVGGIGLENVKRRLELLYPKCHSLEISETDQEYKVVLRIEKR